MIDELQKKFGSDQVRFVEGNGGLTKVLFTTVASSAEMYLHGAHVTHYQPRGHQPVLYLSSASAFRADKPIRGGVPICWPWFGPRADNPTLPMHGFARVTAWTVDSVIKLGDDRVRMVLRLESNEATMKLWPHEFAAKYTVTVGPELELEMETVNRSKSGAIISEALHSYLRVGEITQIALSGLTGTTYFDKAANAVKLEERDPVRLSAETDSVYQNTRAAVTITDPVLGRKIRVEKAGSNSTVVWNPFAARAATMADLGPDEWKQYVCVEAVNALENSVTLAPGATHTIRTTLKVL